MCGAHKYPDNSFKGIFKRMISALNQPDSEMYFTENDFIMTRE